jgi:hypothetical protein
MLSKLSRCWRRSRSVFMILVAAGLGFILIAAPANAWIPVGVEISFISQNGHRRCLDADTHTAGRNGTKVQLWECNNKPQQRWVAKRNAQNYVEIKNGLNGKCLDADTNTLDRPSTIVHLWKCEGTPQQQWADDEQGDEQIYILTSRIRPAKVLDADVHTERENGTIIQLWKFNGLPQQAFWQGRY